MGVSFFFIYISVCRINLYHNNILSKAKQPSSSCRYLIVQKCSQIKNYFRGFTECLLGIIPRFVVN
jgi:hypothetical protein